MIVPLVEVLVPLGLVMTTLKMKMTSLRLTALVVPQRRPKLQRIVTLTSSWTSMPSSVRPTKQRRGSGLPPRVVQLGGEGGGVVVPRLVVVGV